MIMISYERIKSYFLGPTDKVSFDVRTIRFLIGVIAIGLAIFVQLASPWSLTSISGSYFAGDWPRNIFVGCLFFIAGFLFAYNGEQRIERWLSKIAAIAAIGVAIFPCDCAVEAKLKGTEMLQCLGKNIDRYPDVAQCLMRFQEIGENIDRYPDVAQCLMHFQEIKGVHYTSALVMFGILAAFCYIFYARARKKVDERRTAARRRMIVYSTSLVAIVLAIVALLIEYFSSGRISAAWPTFVFWGEFVGLVSFGASWITASHVVPGLAHKQRERYQPFRSANPPEPYKE